jgi:citrate lyase subunit beta/citryl-CoA lyase
MIDHSSFLFIPANKIGYLFNESIKEADAIIIDFEDAWSYSPVKFKTNDLNDGLDYVKNKSIYLRVPAKFLDEIINKINIQLIEGVMIPKFLLSELNIKTAKKVMGIDKKILILIESSKGILDLNEALSKFRIDGVFFGSEDYITSINAVRNQINLFYARSNIVNISRAHDVNCYDTIYPYLEDDIGFEEEVELAFNMGFDGKMAIHPKQLKKINQIFKFNAEKVKEYKLIIQQYEKYSKDNDTNIMVIDGNVIEPPHIKRMKAIIEKYKRSVPNE